MINAQLSPPIGFQSSVQTTGSAITSIDASCHSVINMPVVSSPSAPSLSTDINNAKSVANQWFDSIRRQVMASLEGIVGFNEMFQGVFNGLYTISVQIAAGNTTEIAEFQIYLSAIQNATQAQETLVNQVQNVLTGYLIQVDGAMNALNNDSGQLQSMVNAYNQQMQNLQNQMREVQQKIDDEQSNIFSKLWYELTGQLNDLKNEQNQLQNDLNNTANQLNQANYALNTVKAYQNSFSQIQGGINGLANGWESLNGDLKETLEDENITDYNAFTPALIQAASSDWQVVANLANSFL